MALWLGPAEKESTLLTLKKRSQNRKIRASRLGSLYGSLAWRAASRIGKELPFPSATEAAARVSAFDGVQCELRLDCFAGELPHGDSVSKRGVR